MDNVHLCDVCHKQPMAFVLSSPFGAMSNAYCVECNLRLAEPEWTFEYLYCDVGNKGEGLADWIKESKTFKDDRYWTWDEWKTWRNTQSTECPTME